MITPQNNSKGILYILMGMVLFSIQDALIKFIYEDAALYEMYFGRTFVALILVVGYLKFSKQKISLKTHYPFLTILRVICFFFGFSLVSFVLKFSGFTELHKDGSLFIGWSFTTILINNFNFSARPCLTYCAWKFTP